MRRTLFAAPIALCAVCFANVPPQQYQADVDYLASPGMKGRGDGTPELNKAAKYIAHQFRGAHLQPLNGSYFQEFTLTAHAKLGRDNHLSLQEPKGRQTLNVRKDYLPFSFSGNGNVTAPVVFAGFGITAPEFNYDDYAGLEVKGKIVLVLRHEPGETSDGSFFAGREATIHSQFFSKATNAKQHGAVGILLVSDAANHENDGDTLERFSASPGPNDSGIPFVQITIAAADQFLAGSGKTVKQLQQSIDQNHKPSSFEIANAEAAMKVDIQRERKQVRNVVGYLPGETSEYVIIGAHYDHLGLGEQFSLAPTMVGTVHPGADDNASGTAGVIELARQLSSGPKPKRGVLFLTFAGEELGLLGSSYYVNHPLLPLNQAVAMINMDMIGRIKDERVYVGGVATGTTFRSELNEAANGVPFRLDVAQQALNGSSDHTSFQSKQIPSLFFFSGLHGDYHKPSDTPDKINSAGAAQLLDVIAKLTRELENAPGRPEFVRQQAEAPSNPHGGSAPASSGSGYGPYFGSIPDFAEVPNGVRFADVTAGSPAGKAGLKAGDILVEFAGKPVQNLYDFTYSLRAQKPGDTVRVKVLRDGKPLEVEVTLAQRR